MELHRDASDRLTASHPSDEDAYPRFVRCVVEQFGLKPAGSKVVGLDAVFQDFAVRDVVVSLEWDTWLGCMAVAKSSVAEGLIEEIARFVASQSVLD